MCCESGSRFAGPPPNPTQEFQAADRTVRIRWDNLPEYTTDPQTGVVDLKGYSIWKLPGWKRPPGSSDPPDALWREAATYYLHTERNPLARDHDRSRRPVTPTRR